jgi:hypothetical protein
MRPITSGSKTSSASTIRIRIKRRVAPEPSVRRPNCAKAISLHLSRRHAVHGMQEVPACISLAMPGRPIGPWSRRTGAPEASATRRDPDPDAHSIAHGTGRDTPGWARTGRDGASASGQLDGLVEAKTASDSILRGQFRSRCVGTPAGSMPQPQRRLSSAGPVDRPPPTTLVRP